MVMSTDFRVEGSRKAKQLSGQWNVHLSSSDADLAGITVSWDLLLGR